MGPGSHRAEWASICLTDPWKVYSRCKLWGHVRTVFLLVDKWNSLLLHGNRYESGPLILISVMNFWEWADSLLYDGASHIKRSRSLVVISDFYFALTKNVRLCYNLVLSLKYISLGRVPVPSLAPSFMECKFFDGSFYFGCIITHCGLLSYNGRLISNQLLSRLIISRHSTLTFYDIINFSGKLKAR